MSSDNPPREVFGPYLVYEKLGVGGMATVHRAKKRGIEGFERVSALKRLLPHLAQDTDFVKSFVREAKLAAMLQHANISQIYELGRVGPTYFMAMEYIEGYDVRRILRQARRAAGPPPVAVVLSIIGDLCDALDYAHTRTDDATGEPLGIVHRDVSPSNLIISHAGHLKVIDFGIAKATHDKLKTDTGRVKGKLGYMSPEAVRGDLLDARSDIFSAGIIAHELLTARPLFASKNDYETLTKITTGDIEPPSVRNPQCPVELDDLILKALARSAHERWASAAAMREALHQVALVYKMSATHSATKDWIDWAFTQRNRLDTTGPVAAWRPPTGPAIPSGIEAGPPIAEADEEIIEIAWGGRDDGLDDSPVVLPGVPDISDQIPGPITPTSDEITLVDDLPADPGSRRRQRAPTISAVPSALQPHITFTTPTPTPSPSSGELQLRVRNASTMKVTPIPPMPRPNPPPDWATGTDPPRPRRAAGTDAPPDATTLPTRTAAQHLQRLGRGTARVRPMRDPVRDPVHARSPRGFTYAIAIGAALGIVAATTAFLVRRGDGDSAAHPPAAAASENAASGRSPVTPPPARTTLKVNSTPEGLAVAVDGKYLDSATPLTTQIEPGVHEITLADQGVELWSDKFQAEAHHTYTFHPVLESSGTPIVPWTAVTRKRGKMPKLDGAAEIKAKLCIDRRGKVTTVELQKAPRKYTRKIKRRLARWRYQPYRRNGKRTKVCFAVSLELD